MSDAAYGRAWLRATTTPKAKDSNLDLVELGAQMAMRKEGLLAEMEE